MPEESNSAVATRILIVEDEMIVSQHLALILQRMGYEVAGIASTGALAVQLAEQSNPAIVLMDVNLPGEIDGIEASQQIRARLDVPVVFLSAYDEKDVVHRAQKAESYGYIAKPFSQQILRITIESALYKHASDKRVRESEEQYRTLVEQSIDGIALVQGITVRFVNRAFARMFGFQSPEEMVGQNFLTFVAPEYRDLMDNRALEPETGKSITDYYEFTALRMDGTPFDAELRGNFTTYQGEKISQVIVRDNSDRKKAEEALRESEEKFRLFMDNSPTIAWMKDDQGRHTYLSQTYENRFGVRLDDWLGKTDHELWPQEIAQEFWENDQKVLASGCPMEITEETIDGESQRCSWLNFKFPFQDASGKRYVGGIGIDITHRKRAEKVLRRSESLLREAQRVAHIGHWEIESPIGTPTWSEELFHIFGLDPARGEPSFAEHQDFIHPEDWDLLRASMTRGAADGIPFDIEFRFIRPDKSIRWMNAKGYPTSKREGEFFRVFGTAQDITERRQAENLLRYERERFQMLSESAPFGMVVISKDASFEYVNPKFTEIFGYDLNDVPNGRDWIQRAYPDRAYRHEVVSAWKGVFEGLPAGEAASRAFTVRCKDGSHKIINFRAVKLGSGEVLMVCEDITDRTRSEEEIKKSQAALRGSEERYRAVFDNAGIGIDLVDRDGRFMQVNNALISMLGYTDREFHQLRFTDITHPDDREISKQTLEKVMRREISTYRLEKRYIKKDGSTMWGDLSVSAIRNANGEHIATLAVIADITDRKEAEEALKASHDALAEYSATLEAKVQERTSELEQSRTDLKIYSESLEKANEALKLIIRGIGEQKKEVETKITQNLNLTVKPLLDQLKSQQLPDAAAFLLRSIEFSLSNMFSSFGFNILKDGQLFTPKEMRICEMIRSGLSSKEIAKVLNISPLTVLVHRKKVRKKLSLAKSGTNLASFLKANF